MRYVFGFLLVLTVGCDNLDTSYDLQKVPTPPEKGTACTLDFKTTCWSETIKKVTACLNEKTTGAFSYDQRFCTNDQKMLIDFIQPQKMFVNPWVENETPIQFRILSDSQNECLRVVGTRQHFVITLSQTGERVELQRDQGVLRYSCLDGQEIRVDEKNFAGCGERAIPGLDLRPFAKGDGSSGWIFAFTGTDQGPVFQCHSGF